MTRRDKIVNFVIGTTDAVGFPIGIAFFSLQTIIPAFLHRCGASEATVGALSGISSLLVLAPGLLIVGALGRRPYLKGWLFWVALIERLVLLPLAFLAPLWGLSHPSWLILATFLCFCAHSLCMGFNIPAYWTVIAKTVPMHWRGRMYGVAGGIAGLCTLGTERILRTVVLGGANGGFPNGFGNGFLIGFTLLTASIMPFLFLREPRSEPREGGNFRWADALAVWHADARFRRLAISQTVYVLTNAAAPFLALLAEKKLGKDAADLALYTTVYVFTSAVGSLFIGWLADRWGNRPMTAAACLFGAATFLLAIVAPNNVAFALVFALWALATAGIDVAANTLMMELAGSSEKIPLYSALYNIVRAAPKTLAPWLGGLLVGWLGYPPIMAFAAIAALASLLLLGEGRGKLRT
ncbi:MAG: MFS transporter [Armatimonas sp.]